MEYRGVKLINIKSGMGGTLPAALCDKDDASSEVKVICLHNEYFTNWMVTVAKDEITNFSYKLTDDMKKIIDSRIN